ncbi:MAG: adenine phosphoribosyltransferase [Thermostichus sp. DG_1_6_bins_120]
MDLRSLIRLVPDFPKPGILFRDMTPLLQDPTGFRVAIEQLAAGTASMGSLDYVVGIESRGFILGAALARHLGLGFVPVRKPGKLPPPVLSQSYSLEYGQDQLQLRAQALHPGERVLIVDDLIATGGTAAATAQLVAQTGAEVGGFAFLIELAFLSGCRALPAGIPTHVLMVEESE